MGILLNVSPSRMKDLLTQTLDSSLNSPLHLSVIKDCPDVAQVLINFGADPTLRNMRGDTPSQWFGIPRISKASQICRQSRHEDAQEDGMVASSVPSNNESHLLQPNIEL